MHSYKSIYVIIFLLLFPFCLSASNHYVDKNASGQNNGTSWANAWQSFSAINWGSIQPGDIIYISGGTDSTVYFEALTIEKSGTKANPITIRNSYQAGHNGRVILDGNNYSSGTLLGFNVETSYIYIKGLEVRKAGVSPAVHIITSCNVITLDSLLIYDNRDRAIRIAGDDSNPTVTGHADSITIKNCYLTARKDEPTGQTDLIYAQDCANIILHDNFFRMNQVNDDNLQHVDLLQGHRTRGWRIYNNYFVADSSTKTQVIILGAWDMDNDSEVDSVIFYNNFLFDTGIWNADGQGIGDATVFYMRYYDRANAVYPPTVAIHNTIISYGPNYYNTRQEYPITYAANNIFAQYDAGDAEYEEYHPMITESMPSGSIPVSHFDNNLYYREWAAPNWTGSWTGNGNTGSISGWSSWTNTYGGNGVNDNPEFEYDFANHRQINILDYTMEDWRNGFKPTVVSGTLTINSPARNQGLNLQSVVEAMGFEWKDIYGNPRDSSPDIGAYQYSGGGGTTFPLSVNIINGWNLVSVPGINPNGMDIDTWWPERNNSSNVFKFDDSYFPITTTTPGEGYLMKHSGTNIYNTGDEWPAEGIQIIPHNPINATTGWNLIGGYENSAPTAAITTNPPGLISGPIYKYSGTYQVATTIKPGYGYWIQLTGSGQIILPESLSKENEPTDWFPKDWGRIFLQDATGINYTLYAVKGEVDLNQYELPPATTEGMFDIRYNSGRIAEDINSSIKTIEMSGVTFPLTVRVENMDIRLQDETGKQINIDLKSGEDVVFSDGTIDKLLVSSELKPTKYTLEQNYPNPFNPSTVIEFSLPEDVGNVKLSIYDTLGEKVTELINTSLVAGKYSFTWNAQNVATGMYIYELKTDKFVSVRKMLLLK